MPQKEQRWIFNRDERILPADEGVKRKILSYNDNIMCVEHSFEAGAKGKVHTHPHTQITYIAKGKFEFTIQGETKIVEKGDSLYKEGGVEHGCLCLEEGVLLDVFTPIREDFLNKKP